MNPGSQQTTSHRSGLRFQDSVQVPDYRISQEWNFVFPFIRLLQCSDAPKRFRAVPCIAQTSKKVLYSSTQVESIGSRNGVLVQSYSNSTWYMPYRSYIAVPIGTIDRENCSLDSDGDYSGPDQLGLALAFGHPIWIVNPPIVVVIGIRRRDSARTGQLRRRH